MPVDNSWHPQQELILKKWSEEAMAYRYMHDRSYKHFASLHMYFSLPVIIISTIAGTANFATGSFPESMQQYVSLATGGLGLIASMITTVGQFMKIPEMLEQHRASSTDFAKLSRNIRIELALPIRERTCSGREFIHQCRTDMENLMERSPDIGLWLVKRFGNQFKKKEMHMPDIIDLSRVEIYEDVDEAQRLAEHSEKQIEMAAERLLREKEDTKVRVSHISDNLSNFMTGFTSSAMNASNDFKEDIEQKLEEEMAAVDIEQGTNKE